MITEDYISFEVAKLLKEKEFDEKCIGYYPRGENVEINYSFIYERNSDWVDGSISAPTLQMAMKWLREVHNLSVEVYRTACGYIDCIVAIPSGTDIKVFRYDGDDLPSGQYTTFEKACESAIKYCLTNLI